MDCMDCGDMAATGEKKWSELPEELIVLISEFCLYADYFRFRSVCVSWYSVVPKNRRQCFPRALQHQRYFFPFLFLPFKKGNLGLLSIPENGKIYHLPRLPKEFRSMHSLGSSHGWLVMVDMEATSSMYLINPFTSVQLPLPPMSTFHHLLEYQTYRKRLHRVGKEDDIKSSYPCVEKVVLSSRPWSSSQFQSSDVVAIAILHGGKVLAFSRPGYEAWKPLGFRLGVGEPWRFLDVLFYRDHLYVIRERRSGVVVDYREILVFHMDIDICGGGLVPKLVDTLLLPVVCHHGFPPCLVESGDDLLMVAREIYYERLTMETRFRVFKLCRGNSDDNESSTWMQIKNLGDRMLFMSLNSSFSLSSHDFPFPRCRGNHIYFTDQWRCPGGYVNLENFNAGVYNLEDNRTKPFPFLGSKGSKGRHLLLRKLGALPIWIARSPN